MSDIVFGLGVYNHDPPHVRIARRFGARSIASPRGFVSSQRCTSCSAHSYGASIARCLPAGTISLQFEKVMTQSRKLFRSRTYQFNQRVRACLQPVHVSYSLWRALDRIRARLTDS
jgi:hypothetical protein